MPRDLLAELQSRANRTFPEDGEKGSTDENEIVVIEIENNNREMATHSFGQFRERTSEVDLIIEKITDQTERVKDIHAYILSSPDGGDRTAELEDVMSEVKKFACRAQALLKVIKQEADEAMEDNHTSAVARMKRIQQETLSRRFADLMTAYNTSQLEYRDKCKDRIKRQLHITGKTTTDDQLEEMIESGNVDVFTQGSMIETQRARQALADVQARHKDILQLEKSIRDLRDLFIEMAVLVEGQGDLIDRIEFNVANSAEYVEKAKQETHQAAEYQQAALKKKFWLIGIAIIVLIIILIAIFA